MGKDEFGCTALMCAARYGQTACLSALMAAKADLQTKYDGWAALMYAAYHGHTACLSALMAAKAELDLKNDRGETALDVATRCRQPDCVRLIKEMLVFKTTVRQWCRIFSAPDSFL